MQIKMIDVKEILEDEILIASLQYPPVKGLNKKDLFYSPWQKLYIIKANNKGVMWYENAHDALSYFNNL